MPVTTCAWDREGKCIAGGIGDGSIQVKSFCLFFSLLCQTKNLTFYFIEFRIDC